MMLCPPATSLLVLRVAVPFERLPVPNEIVPSLKVTVPLAVPGDTVAVNITAWLKGDGLAEDARPVVVDAAFTDWVSPALVLPP